MGADQDAWGHAKGLRRNGWRKKCRMELVLPDPVAHEGTATRSLRASPALPRRPSRSLLYAMLSSVFPGHQ
jgi:hypothetical protein